MKQESDTVPAPPAYWSDMAASLAVSVPWKSAWAVCDNAMFAATNFLVAVAVARHVSLDEYGTYALAQSIVLFISTFHTAFLTEPVLVFGSERYRNKIEAYILAAIAIHVVMFVVIESCLAITIVALSRMGMLMWAHAVSMAAVGSPLILLGWFLRKACYVKKAPEIACTSGLIYVAVVGPCIWILTMTGTMNGFRAFLVMGVAAIPAGLWILFRLHVPFRLPHPRSFLAGLTRQHYSYGRWALGAGAMRWVPFNLPLIALASSASAAQSGALRALMTVLMPPVQFFQAVNTMLIPFCAGRSRAKVAQLVTAAGGSQTLVAIAYSVLMWFFSHPLLHSLYGGKYDLYAPYLPPLSLLLLGEALAGATSSALRALELPKNVFAGCFAGALLTGIGIICLRSFEMREAVWLIVVVYAVTAAMLGVSLSRVLGGRGLAWHKTGQEPCA